MSDPKSTELLEHVRKLLKNEGIESNNSIEEISRRLIESIAANKDISSELSNIVITRKGGIIRGVKNKVATTVQRLVTAIISPIISRQQKFNDVTYQLLLTLIQDKINNETARNKSKSKQS